MSFSTLYKKLLGWMPIDNPSLAKSLINEARADIYSKYNWSFLFQEDSILIPALINQGTVNVQRFSKDVIVSSDLKTIIDNIENDINQVRITERQFRANNSTSKIQAGEIYNIEGWNSDTSILTLDRPYADEFNSASPFEIFKNLISPPFYLNPISNEPEIDFKNFHSIIDTKQRRNLWLYQTYNKLNSYDPTRISRGFPYAIYTANRTLNGIPQYELFPYYSNTQSDLFYRISYFRKGKDFEEDDEEIPNVLSEELIDTRARIKFCEWAILQSERITELKNYSRFMNLSHDLLNPNNEQSYPWLLEEAKRRDNDVFPQSFLGNYFMEYPYFDRDYSFNNYENLMSPFEPPRETLVISF